MEYLVGFVVLCLLGVSITSIVLRLSTVGTLRIDHTDPEKDKYLFEIDDLDRLSKKKRIVLKVDNSAILSQK